MTTATTGLWTAPVVQTVIATPAAAASPASRPAADAHPFAAVAARVTRLLALRRGVRPDPGLADALDAPAAASTAPVQLLRAVAEGELAAFDELLPTLGLTHRIVGLPDGRDRLDVALGTVQVGILFFGQDGKLESAKLWEKIPTVQLDVVAAELLQHDGIRVVLDSSSEDLAAEVRHRLSALATSFEDVAA